MTKITITAESQGKNYDINFTVANDITQSQWDQLTQLLKMAMNSTATNSASTPSMAMAA